MFTATEHNRRQLLDGLSVPRKDGLHHLMFSRQPLTPCLVQFRIQYRIHILFVFKSLPGFAPSYIIDFLRECMFWTVVWLQDKFIFHFHPYIFFLMNVSHWMHGNCLKVLITWHLIHSNSFSQWFSPRVVKHFGAKGFAFYYLLEP